MTWQSPTAIARQAEQEAHAIAAFLAGKNPNPTRRVKVMAETLRKIASGEKVEGGGDASPDA